MLGRGGMFLGRALQVSYLVVAGGGGGGANVPGSTGRSSGAGAGGLLAGTLFLNSASYAVTVGAGGGVNLGGANQGSKGGDSSIGALVVATGGGGGGGTLAAGGNGGSGGGGGNFGLFGTGIAGQGFNGNYDGIRAGGGGGAGGAPPNPASAGGGPGVASSITGASVTYAVGGSGANAASPVGPGSGGDGGDENVSANPTPGNAGVVIFSYQGSARGTGGTITSVGGFTIHTFTSSGTFVIFRRALFDRFQRGLHFSRARRWRGEGHQDHPADLGHDEAWLRGAGGAVGDDLRLHPPSLAQRGGAA